MKIASTLVVIAALSGIGIGGCEDEPANRMPRRVFDPAKVPKVVKPTWEMRLALTRALKPDQRRRIADIDCSRVPDGPINCSINLKDNTCEVSTSSGRPGVLSACKGRSGASVSS